MIIPFTQKTNIPILGISGITRSGKAMISNIVSTFDRVEKSNVDVILEQFYYLYRTKNLDKKTAIYLIRKNLNLFFYYNSLGRNVNFRKSDFTSIFNYPNPKLYLRRTSTLKEGDFVFKNNKSLVPLMLHNGLQNIDIIFEALPGIKIIEMIKNPVELVYSWIQKNYGEDIYEKPRIYVLTIKYQNNIYPYYAKGWESKYKKMNPYDRAGEMIIKLINERNRTYNRLSINKKKQLLIIHFDDFVTNTDKNLIKLKKFLKRRQTKFTKKTLKKHKCPRIISKNDYMKKKTFLKKKLSRTIYDKIILLEKNYFKSAKNEKNTNL